MTELMTPQNDLVAKAKRAGVWQAGYRTTTLVVLTTVGFARTQISQNAYWYQAKRLTFSSYRDKQEALPATQELNKTAVVEEQYVQARKQLTWVRNLQRGWDTYDAETFAPRACDTVLQIIAALQVQQMLLNFVVPTSDGSILLKHQAGQTLATWEVDNDGEIGLMLERIGDEPEFLSIEPDSIDAAVASLAWNG